MGTYRGDRAVRACVAAAAFLLALCAFARADDNEPFALGSMPVAASHPLAIIWQKLQTDMQAERAAITECRADPAMCGSAAILQFIAIADAGDPHGGLDRAGRVGRAVNLALRKLNRLAADGGATAWTTPLQALNAGAGDCKQFAVLKYAALRAAGFAADEVRLVIVMNKAQQESHAVVTVLHRGVWFVLDSATLAVAPSHKIAHYEPLFSLDERGARGFVSPSLPVAVAPRGPKIADRTPVR